jgi:hypothetical protein
VRGGAIKKYEQCIDAREKFKKKCEEMAERHPELAAYQQKLIDEREGPSYNIETPIVYNSALDGIQSFDAIKLLLVADNPGRREQNAAMRSYLVGPAGKIADTFFKKKSGLTIDFRKNVLILNKTPIHTPRTGELRTLCEIGGEKITRLIDDSQRAMVNILVEFYMALKVPIWIIGYSEMKKRGIFETYTRELVASVSRSLIRKQDLFFFRHFSMNQFTIDLNKQRLPDENIESALQRIGYAYRDRVLGGI